MRIISVLHVRNFASSCQFVVLLILSLWLSFASTEWVQRSVTPTDESYTAVTWPADGIVVAVGAKSAGYIIRSSDYGVSWTQVATSLTIGNMFGIASRTVDSVSYTYTCDSNGRIYRSTDEGANWSYLYQHAATLYGTAIGQNGRLYFGGPSGTILTGMVTSTSSYTAVAFTGTGLGIVYGISTIEGNSTIAVTGAGRIFFTRNGGSSWTSSGKIFNSAGAQSNNVGGALYCVSMANSTVAYTAGASGVLYKSETAGRTWNQLTSPLSGSDIRYQSMSTLDSLTVFLAGANGCIYASFDGGYTWNLQYTASGSLTSLTMYSLTRGVAGGGTPIGMFALVPSKT